MSPLNTKRLTRRRFVRHVVATAVAATATRPWVLAAAPCAVGPLQQSMQRAAGCCLAWLNRDQQFLPTGGYEVAHDTGRWSIALRLVGPALACLAALPGTAAPAGPPARNDHVPKLAGEYVHIYNPRPDVYSGRSTAHYTRGVTYSHWRTNDHTFIKGPDRRWHCFGITKPDGAPGGTGHEAEGTAFHAVAPEGPFADVAFKEHAWTDRPKINVADCGWAPVVIKNGREYSLIGSHLGRATSGDLSNWTDQGKLTAKGTGRDPNILYWNKTYYLYRCAGNGVSLVTSADFVHWTDPVDIYRPAIASYQTESPSIVPYGEKFYLFWCLWDTADKSTYGYCPRTYVYCADKPSDFRNAPLVAELKTHAPEVFQDEAGQWYISSADYPTPGIHVARLAWQ